MGRVRRPVVDAEAQVIRHTARGPLPNHRSSKGFTMKITPVSAVLLSASLFSGLAAAQEGTQDFPSASLSSRTRAEVLAELQVARASGQLEQRGDSYGGVDTGKFASTRSRAEVLAEYTAARRASALDMRNYAASYGSFRIGEIASTRSRSEVLADLTKAQPTPSGPSRGERKGS
jgi:hypothetical protein